MHMTTGTLVRLAFVAGAGLALIASASSGNTGAYAPAPTGAAPQSQTGGPPASQPMDPSSSLGLWRSTFGAVKIEPDNSQGGIAGGAIHGVYVYQKAGAEVTGYFSGRLDGNVLNFRWQEPSNPPLGGAGYLVFDVRGQQYSGRWWSDARDRVGVWNGWRQAPTQGNDPYSTQSYGGDAYGGASYGNSYPPPAPSY